MNSIEIHRKAKSIYQKHVKLSGPELGKEYALKSADTCKKLAPIGQQEKWDKIIIEIQKM
jgi:hypothetical protein